MIDLNKNDSFSDHRKLHKALEAALTAIEWLDGDLTSDLILQLCELRKENLKIARSMVRDS